MLNTTNRYHIYDDIASKGYSVVPADAFPLTDGLRLAWHRLLADYQTLPADDFLPNGGNYRFRRYDRFYFMPVTGELHVLPHEDYFQGTDINAVTGGMVRQFAPLLPETIENPFLHELIRFDFDQFPLPDVEQQYNAWQVDVHEIYVVAHPGMQGHPTPEGIHRDGAEFVTVHLAALDNANGGVVTVYDDDKRELACFQLAHVLDSYLFNDTRLWHGVTPITSADGVRPARRGILTFDYHYKPDLKRPDADND